MMPNEGERSNGVSDQERATSAFLIHEMHKRNITVILVIGSVTAQNGRVEEALRLSHEHVARSRAEPGCIAHAVHIDAENPNRLVFVEQWADQAALARHFQVPASGNFVRALAGLATQAPSMSIYEATQLQS